MENQVKKGPAPLQQKAIDCLLVASTPERSEQRGRAYREACERWQVKPVLRKFEELKERGYLRYHVHPVTAVLTQKGMIALQAAEDYRARLQAGMKEIESAAIRNAS